MSSSTLQERINELCARVVATTDPAELERIISELRLALQQQVARLNQMIADARDTISGLPATTLLERRGIDRRRRERRTLGRATAPAHRLRETVPPPQASPVQGRSPSGSGSETATDAASAT